MITETGNAALWELLPHQLAMKQLKTDQWLEKMHEPVSIAVQRFVQPDSPLP